jgi:hypothetical protein
MSQDILPLLVFFGLIALFFYKLGRFIVSLVRPDLLTQWKPVQGDVTRVEDVEDGWHLFMTYTVNNQTYPIEGVMDKRSTQPPTQTELCYKEKDPAIWDWAEDRLVDQSEVKHTKFVWFFVLSLLAMVGILVLLAVYAPQVLYGLVGSK